MTIPGDFGVTIQVWKKIFSIKFHPWELVDGTIYEMGLNRPNFIVAILFLVLLLLVSRYEEKMDLQGIGLPRGRSLHGGLYTMG